MSTPASYSSTSSSSPRSDPDSSGNPTTASPHFPLPQLPCEIRLKIWSCAVEPRVVILDDLVQVAGSYPIPPVTQLNAESRAESRSGYEAIGRGSHLHFARDILVCDPNISDQGSNKPLEDLAPRVRRLAFWDCFPDDGRVDGFCRYSDYLATWYPQESFGKVHFDKFWFPNLEDLWIIKVGEVDRSWKVAVDRDMPVDVRARNTARQFRYWVEDNIVEIAPLDLDDADTKLVLQDGRCGKVDCQELNRRRPKMVSKVIFVDDLYESRDDSNDSRGWKRIQPWSAAASEPEDTEKDGSENRMRWIIVERILTFSLRWEADDGLLSRGRVNEGLRGGRRLATGPPLEGLE
ncbi:hypothetical protein RJ55_01814 [Drechmeria coniospora]|nr:hypothetical protein RJ55_01814 [Drechmeria coniospora]